MCENDLLLTGVRTSYKQQEADCNCLLPRQPFAHLLDACIIKTFISLRNRELSLYCGLKTYKIPWKQSTTPGNHCMWANVEQRVWHQDQNTNDSTKLYYLKTHTWIWMELLFLPKMNITKIQILKFSYDSYHNFLF